VSKKQGLRNQVERKWEVVEAAIEK